MNFEAFDKFLNSIIDTWRFHNAGGSFKVFFKNFELFEHFPFK